MDSPPNKYSDYVDVLMDMADTLVGGDYPPDEVAEHYARILEEIDMTYQIDEFTDIMIRSEYIRRFT